MPPFDPGRLVLRELQLVSTLDGVAVQAGGIPEVEQRVLTAAGGVAVAMKVAIQALSLGNALSVGEDIIVPVAGRVFLPYRLPAEVHILGVVAWDVLARARAISGLGVDTRCPTQPPTAWTLQAENKAACVARAARSVKNNPRTHFRRARETWRRCLEISTTPAITEYVAEKYIGAVAVH